MYKLNWRSFVLSTAALAAASGVRGAFAQSDVTASLRILTFGGDAQLKATNDSVARFNKQYPNVTVEVAIDPISTGWADYATKVMSQFNAGTNYDVYNTAIETFRTLSSRGLFDPLEDKIAADPSFQDFDKRLFELSSYKGHTYFVPDTWNNSVINYNKKMFTDAGVALPTDTWTWDDFLKAAIALTKRDASGNVTQFGYEVPDNFFVLQPWFITNGTSILNEDWTASNLLDPKVAESFQFLYDLVHVHKVAPIPTATFMDQQFFAGQVAMISRGHWVVQNALASDIEFDVANVPGKVNNDTVIGFGGYALAATSTQKDLAWALMTELASVETQKAEGDLGGGIPGRKSAAETESFLKFPPNAKLYYATLPTTHAVPSPVNFQDVQQIFDRYFTAIMSDEMTIADGLKAADAELGDSFARAAANA